jgi:hypothetical protein
LKTKQRIESKVRLGEKGGLSPTVVSLRHHPERATLMRPILYGMTRKVDPEAVHQETDVAKTGEALSMNISSGGMLLLMDWDPEVGQVLKVHVPTPVGGVRTPTLAEVCWKCPVPMMRSNGTYFVGLKYMF